jgi:TetR/AcrR family transcriptional regulator, tetracycline repressor protein
MEGGTGERSQLDRDRIAAAALELIDAGGLASLSMRKLGSALGVEAMSIYHYVSSKDDLLDAVMERLYGEITIEEPVSGQSWDDAVRTAVRSFHEVLRVHPHTVGLFVDRPATLSQEGFAAFFGGYRLLRLAGLAAPEAHGALHAAVSFVLGHSLVRAGAEAGGRSIDLISDELLEDDAVAEFVSSGRELTDDFHFEQGLTLLVAGLRSEYKLA